MKKTLSAILLVVGLSACATPAQQQADFEARYAQAKQDIINADCERSTASQSASCFGSFADQALVKYSIPRGPGITLELFARQLGERIDRGEITWTDAEAHFFATLDRTVRGRRTADLIAKQRQDAALTQALMGASAQYNSMQRQQQILNSINRPRSLNCNTHGPNTSCVAW